MRIRQSKPPSSRAEFERNLCFLGEAINDGRFHVQPGLTSTIDGIRRVRFLPNRRIDLLTVDETTRLNANTMMQLLDRDGLQGAASGHRVDAGATEDDALAEASQEDEEGEDA